MTHIQYLVPSVPNSSNFYHYQNWSQLYIFIQYAEYVVTGLYMLLMYNTKFHI